MNWIKFKDKKPDCDVQNGNIYSSGYLLTKDSYGEYEVDYFLKVGEHTSRGWVKKEEYWASRRKDIVWWCEIESPKE